MVTHARDLGPGNGRFGSKQIGRQCLDGLTDFKQADPDCVEDQPVRECPPKEVRPDRLDRSEDICDSLLVAVAHSATDSRSTRGRTSGFRSVAGTMSTGAPMISSSAARSRPRPSSPRSAGRSASRSRSLPVPSSPRATLPKSRRLRTPKSAAVATSWRRLLRIRSPSGPDSCSRPAGTCRSSMLSSRPAALISACRTGSEGCRRPDSYALITLWVIPARTASSAWVRPARRRASRNTDPADLSL
jgi:hypothetical protein